MKRNFFLDLISLNTPKAIVTALVLILVILALLPTDNLGVLPVRSVNKEVLPIVFDNCPDSGLLKDCCPSCGLTRATSSLLHGDIQGAWDFNPLVFLVLPLILILIIQNIMKCRTKH